MSDQPWIVTAPAVQVVIDQRVRIVERGGVLPASVAAVVVQRLAGKGMIAQSAPAETEPEEAPKTGGVEEPQGGQDEAPDFSAMNLEQLRAYAAEGGIDLSGATRKDDIIAVLTAA